MLTALWKSCFHFKTPKFKSQIQNFVFVVVDVWVFGIQACKMHKYLKINLSSYLNLNQARYNHGNMCIKLNKTQLLFAEPFQFLLIIVSAL